MSFTYKGLPAQVTKYTVTGEEIDRQLERAAITSISGFGKICDGAVAVLNV